MASTSVWNSLPDNLRDLAGDVFDCDILMYAAHWRFYNSALYKFTGTLYFTFTYLQLFVIADGKAQV